MKKHVLFVGGGTAGHIAPLLAVMSEVKQLSPDTECTYVGLAKDVCSPLIGSSEVTFSRYSIVAGKLNRRISFSLLLQPFLVLAGLVQALLLLKRLKPDVIFSKGGYVSVPVALSAFVLRIPLYCHETDSVPGLANRIVARFARTVFSAYPADAFLPKFRSRIVYTGQPVRDIFRTHHARPKQVEGKTLPTGRKLVTVVGGSQGAHRVNLLMRSQWEALTQHAVVVHITGARDLEWLRREALSLPDENHANLIVTDFITDELPALFQTSDVVVSRAGGVIAELAASRACALLVPLSTSSQGHQQSNAAYLAKKQAAVVFDEVHGIGDDLGGAIKRLLDDDSQRESLRSHISSLDKPHAAREMAEKILS